VEGPAVVFVDPLASKYLGSGYGLYDLMKLAQESTINYSKLK
jgi:hypothetical protein